MVKSTTLIISFIFQTCINKKYIINKRIYWYIENNNVFNILKYGQMIYNFYNIEIKPWNLIIN